MDSLNATIRHKNKTPPVDTQIHVWTMLDDELPVAQDITTSPLLSEQELSRQQRLISPELQYRFQRRREMLRHCLTIYRPDIPASDWVFTENRFGKPQIDSMQSQNKLFFNLSHTKGLTALAISAIEECGIDVENTSIARSTNHLDIADRFFTQAESTQITQGSTHQQIQRFFDFWTLKEAYIKAVGQGLSLGLDRFQFVLNPASPIAIEFPAPAIDDADSWAFHQETIDQDMRLALALRTKRKATITCEFFSYPS